MKVDKQVFKNFREAKKNGLEFSASNHKAFNLLDSHKLFASDMINQYLLKNNLTNDVLISESSISLLELKVILAARTERFTLERAMEVYLKIAHNGNFSYLYRKKEHLSHLICTNGYFDKITLNLETKDLLSKNPKVLHIDFLIDTLDKIHLLEKVLDGKNHDSTYFIERILDV